MGIRQMLPANFVAAYATDKGDIKKREQGLKAAWDLGRQMVKLISVAYSKLGDEKKALEYQEKLKSFPDTEFSAEELYNMGVVEANKGNDGEAAKYLEKATLAKPGFALAHYHLGLCYFRLSNGAGAKKELEKYLTMEPEGDNAKTAKALLASIK